MNAQEVTELLATAAAVDQYAPRPDPLVLKIWASMLADIPVKAAGQAVMAHYRATKTTITPADIVGWFRDRRRYAPPEHVSPPADPAVIRAGIDRALMALAERKALTAAKATGAAIDRDELALATEADIAARRSWRSVRCPVEWCHAAPGQPCTAHGRPLTKSPCHPARMDVAFASQPVSSAQ